MRRRLVPACAALLASLSSGVAMADPAPPWPDDRFHRLAALALVERLRADLLSEPSATVTLERWCDETGLSGNGPARLVATQTRPADTTIAPDLRAHLSLGPDEMVRHRHVLLSCAGHVLSEAENWYVPSRLSPEMRRLLDETDAPFGHVVSALHFTRTTLSSRLLWEPLPADWVRRAPGTAPGGRLSVPDALIENRAVLRRGDGVPFSLVIETYRNGILAFPPPQPGG